ncbi:hypothetical protein PFICI_07063 [Pestalotiopsis fici W106-1]|uniref:Uncharacterized protein n=1 Tax=Pestalotiopsis fici (strain W106-1 / CGMCC3.15140) TaxID=1229662 RepID=W3XA59_PESFW|nr:uncharacterized protein PFICI_07063 [Pestalotiopsis fici W106-1]ETS82061.1 hypothetical protein PFICI_07063 [Pestalotiopsis fici W106-1]
MGTRTDKQTRNLLIRTNIALIQREIREQSNWYNTPRVAIRKRSGKVILSRQGASNAQSRNPSDLIEDYVLVEC